MPEATECATLSRPWTTCSAESTPACPRRYTLSKLSFTRASVTGKPAGQCGMVRCGAVWEGGRQFEKSAGGGRGGGREGGWGKKERHGKGGNAVFEKQGNEQDTYRSTPDHSSRHAEGACRGWKVSAASRPYLQDKNKIRCRTQSVWSGCWLKNDFYLHMCTYLSDGGPVDKAQENNRNRF